MDSTVSQQNTHAGWPPNAGEFVSFKSSKSSAEAETARLLDVRWGLVWQDFVLADGRVIPAHRILGCPEKPEWRKVEDVSEREREECEERLLSMAGAGMDPRERDQQFWAELNQYLAYTYLKFKKPQHKIAEVA